MIVTIPAAAEVKGESKVKSKLRQVNKRILTLVANDPALPETNIDATSKRPGAAWNTDAFSKRPGAARV